MREVFAEYNYDPEVSVVWADEPCIVCGHTTAYGSSPLMEEEEGSDWESCSTMEESECSTGDEGSRSSSIPAAK